MTTSALSSDPTRNGFAPVRWRRAFVALFAAFALVLVGGAAWSYWLAAVTAGSAGAATATSVGAGATPTANASGSSVTVSWAASTLANGQAVTGYEVRRYNSSTLAQQTVLSSCTGVVTALTCVESSVPAGTWRYSVTPVFATNWRGTESAMSTAVTVDTTAPVNALSLNVTSGNAALAGTTVYYRGSFAGSFTITNTLTDASSGPASSQTAALGGTTTGWAHTPSTVSTPTGGPYVSNAFSWVTTTTSSPTLAVTGRDVAGNAATTNLTFVNDWTTPTAGTLSYLNDYQPGRSVSVTFTTGTDAGSGIAARQLQRAHTTLTNGTCGSSYSSFINVGPSMPTSPYVDTSVVNGLCYMYRYVVSDAVGNHGITTSTDVAKVDYKGAVENTSGVLDYWRLGEASSGSAMADAKLPANDGTYFNAPTAGIVGAIGNDASTAVAFDGINDYALAPRQIAGDFSVEFWVKSTQNFVGSLGGQAECSQWWQGAGLVDADLGGLAYDFGVSMCKGKIIVGAGGTSEISAVSPGTYNDNAWHHVVFTRTQLTGVLVLYVDGAQVATTTAGTGTLSAQADLNFGRLGFAANYFAGTLDEVAVYTAVLPAATVTNHYQLGSSPATDLTGPTGGSVDATGLVGTGARYSTSPNLSIAFTPGTDPSGVLTLGNTLSRATATLTNGACGTYGTYTLVTGGDDPVSPKADTVTAGACYRYQYKVADSAGNTTTYTSGDIKVDNTAPSTPTLAISSPVNAYWSGSGSTVYYRSAATSGSFVVTGTSADAQSGIASWAYQAAGTNWTSTAGALGVNTYSWSGAPAAPGTRTVTATNNAGTASASTSLTFVADDTAPSAGTVSYLSGIYSGTSISVSFTTGTDAGSGIASRLLQRATATQNGSGCGTFGSFTTVTGGTNPTSPLIDTVASTGTCYMYRYVVTDNVGNQHIATSSNVARSPGAYWAFSEGFGTAAADSSGNVNSLTLQGTAGWTTRSFGNNALNLPAGSNSFATNTGYPVVNTSESFTVAGWVRLNSTAGYQTITAIDGTSVSPFFLGTNGSGRFRFGQVSADSTGGTFVTISGLANIATSTWYHVVGVYDKPTGILQLYVNGASQGTTPATTSWQANGATSVGRSKWNGGNTDFVNGAIDDVRYYGRVLTASEVSTLAAGGSVAP
jgi:hypothetical protein